jgi:hypothetical protein
LVLTFDKSGKREKIQGVGGNAWRKVGNGTMNMYSTEEKAVNIIVMLG